MIIECGIDLLQLFYPLPAPPFPPPFLLPTMPPWAGIFPAFITVTFFSPTSTETNIGKPGFVAFKMELSAVYDIDGNPIPPSHGQSYWFSWVGGPTHIFLTVQSPQNPPFGVFYSLTIETTLASGMSWLVAAQTTNNYPPTVANYADVSSYFYIFSPPLDFNLVSIDASTT